MKRIALLLFTLLTSASFFAFAPVTQAAQVSDNIVWIDVRSKREFRRGHIECAITIPHGDICHRIFVEGPDTFTQVHIYDGSQGAFAGIVLEMLMEIGFQEVINEGGYDALLEKQGLSEE
jgi:rhodanese-related sulfurtransferase